MSTEYEEQLEELIEKWPLDPANVRCEYCGSTTEWECGNCSVPLCEDRSCVLSHIESCHPSHMPEEK